MIVTVHSGWSWIKAILFISSFVILTAGWVVLYPAAVTSGGLLERIAAQPVAWDWGHRLLLLGVFLQPFSIAVLYERTRHTSMRLSLAAWILVTVGSMALIGQYALDFAVLAQANHVGLSNEAITGAVRENPWASFFFYNLGDGLFFGHILFAIALFKAGGMLRTSSIVVFSGLIMVLGADIHPISIRVGFTAMTLGYLLAIPQIMKDAGS